MTDHNANVHFSVDGADSSKQEIGKIREELEKSGPAGTQNAQKITDGFQNVERASQRVTTKISEGRAVTVRDGNLIIQQFENLKREIESTFGSIANAPVAVQQGFAKAEAQFHSTTAAVKTMTTATRENQQAVLGNTAQWGGFEQQLLKIAGADGALGKTAIGMGGVIAAFEGGWAIGMKLNKLFGTDMSLWEEKTEVWGKKLGVLVQDLADIIVAESNLIYDTATGHFSAAKRDLMEVGADVQRFGKDIGHVLGDGTAAWNEYATGTNRAKMATKGAEEGAAKLRDEQHKLAEEIANVTKEIKKENDELNKQKGIAEDATLALSDATNNQGHYQREVSSASSAVEEQKRQVQELSEKYGDSSLVVQQAREKQAQLESSLRSSQQRLDETTAEVSKYESAQRAARDAIHQHEEKVKELNIEKGKEELALKKVTDALNGPEGHIKKVEDAAEATRKLQSQTNMANVAFTNAVPHIEDFKKVFAGDTGLNAMLSTAKQLLMDIAEQCSTLPGAVGPAATALHSLGDAANAAAGSTTSPTDPRSMAGK